MEEQFTSMTVRVKKGVRQKIKLFAVENNIRVQDAYNALAEAALSLPKKEVLKNL